MHADPVAHSQRFRRRLGHPKRRARHGKLLEPRPPTLDIPVIIIGKTMLMHARVHCRAADVPDAIREAVHQGRICESCDDLVMNAFATAALG